MCGPNVRPIITSVNKDEQLDILTEIDSPEPNSINVEAKVLLIFNKCVSR